MNCRDAQSLLTAYHEGYLTPDQRAGLEQHLGSCPRCRVAEEQLRQVHERLAGFFGERRLPADFGEMVLKAATAKRESSLQPAFPWRALAAWGSIAAAAALGLTLILASMWQVGDAPVSPDSTAAVEKSGDRAAERPATRSDRTGRKKPAPGPAIAHERPTEAPHPAEAAGPDTETADSVEPAIVSKDGQQETAPEDKDGHGRPSNIGGQLLASPREGNVGPALPAKEKDKRPDGPKVGPRRPGQVRPGKNGQQGEEETRRELAERIRQRRGNMPAEVAELEPEERRKLGSSMKESVDKGVPPAVAARVVQLVLKKGLTPDDARKALRTLNAAVGKGVRPALFAAGLERMLNSLPEGASFDRALRRLAETLGSAGDNGKTN